MNIVLKISFLSIAVLVALAAATGVTAEKHFLQAERNVSTSFECSKLKTTGCELYKYVTSKQLVIKRTQTIDKRFTIRDSEFCIIDINTLKVFDSVNTIVSLIKTMKCFISTSKVSLHITKSKQ
uniref:Uncharacterized protein n=1 Tax=Strigamia maritima TaxID=126957 RepID=T1J932_STRMM